MTSNLRMNTSASLVGRTASGKKFSFRRRWRRPSSRVSLWILVGLMIVCGAREAAADRAIAVDVVGAPFEPGELVAALRFRVAPDGRRLQLRVTATEHGVRIEGPGGMREIALGGLRGAAAARLVALAASDLLLDDLAGLDLVASSLAAPGPAPGSRAPATLGVLGGVSGWAGMLGDLAVDVTVPREGWLVAIELGGGELVDSTLHVTAAVLRACGGLRAGPLEARMGLTAVPVLITSGAGDQTVLLGANASVRVRIALPAGVRGVLAGGADVFATRTEYRLAGMPVLTTPRAAPWLAAGLEVGL
jgi:hypothetical protein